MKRILSVILCLAVFLSSMVIGVISTASAEGAGAVTPAKKYGADETKLPTAATESLTGGAVQATDSGYELTGNLTIGADNATVLADVETALNAGKVFDGKGYTITLNDLNAPIFSVLTNGTIKNLVVAGKTTDGGAPKFGTFVRTIDKGTVTFENVVVTATITSTVADDQGLGGFVGNIRNTVEGEGETSQVVGIGNVVFTNCMFDGKILPKDNTISVRGGGFVGKMNSAETTAKLEGCTASGEISFAGQQGGFFGEVNADSFVTINNCYSDVVMDWGTSKADAGRVGGFVGWVSSSKDGTVLRITNSKSEAKFVYANDAQRYVGGFIGGINPSKEVTLEDCVSNVDVVIPSTVTNLDDRIGGFIGSIQGGIQNVTKITLRRCTNESEFDFNLPTQNLGFAISGFIARVQINSAASKGMTVTFDECVNNADITVNSYSNAAGRGLNVAGFLAFDLSNATYNFINCVNNGDMVVYAHHARTSGSDMGETASGFVGYTHDSTNAPTLNFEGCVNNGDVSVCSRSRYQFGGGFIGANGSFKAKQIVALQMRDCVNTGDISVVAWDGVSYENSAPTSQQTGATDGTATTLLSRAYRPDVGGLGASVAAKKATITNFMNFGKISVDNQGDFVDGKSTILGGQCRAAGVIATTTGNIAFENCINAGDVQLSAGIVNAEGGRQAAQPAAGIVSLGAGGVTYNYCVNFGDITSDTTISAAIVGYNQNTDVTNITNCMNFGKITDTDGGSFAVTNQTVETQVGAEFKGCYNFVADMPALKDKNNVNIESTGVETMDVEFPTYCTPDKTKSVNAKAYITLILANLDADLATAYVADDFKGDKVATVDRLNNLIQPDVIFGVTFDKDLYDAIEAIVGDENVKVEGIVTLSKYVDKIGAFTHEAFDEYYEANAEALADKNVTKLYMDATRTEANIGSGDLVDGDYFVNIRLIEGNAGTVATTYTARAFIQIGDLYIYSSIIADAE